jgi:hypothetical protein
MMHDHHICLPQLFNLGYFYEPNLLLRNLQIQIYHSLSYIFIYIHVDTVVPSFIEKFLTLDTSYTFVRW